MNLVIFILLLMFPWTSQASEPWQLEQDKDGVKIYLRPNPQTGFKDFKAQIIVNLPIKQVKQAFEHVEDHTKWFYLRKLTKVLAKPDNKTWIIYSITDAPWPVTDRDAVVRYRFVSNNTPDHIHIEVRHLKNYLPPKEDYVRVPYIDSWWQLDKIENNKTRITFYNSTDTGGNIPAWLANTGVVDMPYYSLIKLKTMLEEGSLHYY